LQALAVTAVVLAVGPMAQLIAKMALFSK